MTDRGPNHLKAVGGFADEASTYIPDISLRNGENLEDQPMWQAWVYIRFSDNAKLMESLTAVIESKLRGRLASSTFGSDSDQYFILTHFLVEDEVNSRALVEAFATLLANFVTSVSSVTETRSGIEYVGPEEDERLLTIVD